MNYIDLILHGSEERYLEYKGSMSWDDISTKTKVVIACLAMANIPDGGSIVFGVDEEPKGTFCANGMREADVKSFKPDEITSYVNNFADPYVDLKVSIVLEQEKSFVVIQIQEFNDLPIVCKRSGENGVRCGAIYTRPRRKIESVPVPSQNEMREILDLALDKKMRKTQEALYKWGFRADQANQAQSTQEFDSQLGGL